MNLRSPLTEVKGVGQAVAEKLARLGLSTVGDLINHYPRRYEDYSHPQSISSLTQGPVTIRGVIKQAKGRYGQRGTHVTEAVASDETGSVRMIWFNQPYRTASIIEGKEYFISGEFAFGHQRLSIMNPSVELVSNFPINTARIVPIYPETKGLKSGVIRKALREVFPVIKALKETLPEWLINEENIVSRSQALQMLHFPKSDKALVDARQRLGFEEVFELTLAALLNKYALLQEEALSIKFDEQLARDFVAELSFKLTNDQRRVVMQIYKDIEREQPMNRLVEGDVGSGKTVVAAMAALMAMTQDFQVALMAPTELLARQHADTIFNLFQPLGMSERVGLLVGGMTANQKQTAQAAIKEGKVRFIIGTHALIQEKVDMKRLGLVIIDEQHRFGVEQRKTLQAKAKHAVHVLSLTATPIPRSLALTLYGELDISILAEKPANRLPINTELVSLAKRPAVIKAIDSELNKGRQVFWVCPRIEEADDSNPLKLVSAEARFKTLSTNEFKHRKLGLLHGKMKPAEKDQVMMQFLDKKIDILVATTVVEVGVDVPNATVMIIENPERFGLAQLHQLRGRVGRSIHRSYCYLMLADSQSPSRRLRALVSSNDGFKLAELDLELRGPGAVYGTLQHGELDLRLAKLTDTKLIAAARSRAQEFIDKGDDLLQYKELYERVNKHRAITNLN